ncbi:flagellar hook-length control protein FliK [Stenotrophomonas sp.]|uniref:flagellar hook-length control protein FliK n=1 Tax=Stenotrophomonas sp. TaxID=69392 RepID=UPI0028ABE886|nr:flagellar hook-length control protein FliK [Stenotrophomonas sp.]
MNVLSPGVVGSADMPSSSRSAGTAAKAGDNQFDALLHDKPAGEPVAAASSGDHGTEHRQSVQDADAAEEPQPSAAATDKPVAEQEASDRDDTPDAPWPPPGLGGMLAAPVEIKPIDVAAVSSPPAGAVQDKSLPPVLNPAQAAAMPTASTTAAVAEDVVLPQAIQQLATKALSEERDVDTPTPANFAQVLHSQSVPELRALSAATAIDAPTATPELGSDDFDDAIGARVNWLAEQKIGHAHIRISPDHMGQIEVKLQLDGDRVHASFTAANADVRHALESSLPRLREMLGEQGMQLAHADVGQQQNSSPQSGNQGNDAPGMGGTTEAAEITSSRTLRMRGLLDAYA